MQIFAQKCILLCGDKILSAKAVILFDKGSISANLYRRNVTIIIKEFIVKAKIK